MRENDNEFIMKVVDYYYTTIDKMHPNGNMSAVASYFNITRAKVNKILITAGVIDSMLHQNIMELKKMKHSVKDIASILDVSEATVKINIPYEKVIYNGETKSVGAKYVDSFRKREKVFLDNVIKPNNKHEISFEDNYSLSGNVMFLHVELDSDLSEVKNLAQIKYGNTISRDLVVPSYMPLHNLHYALNEAFGFTNSHLHQYEFNKNDLEFITKKDIDHYKELIGLVFKSPFRDEDIDFWDDDYNGGSPKKWMRSKYTGPYYKKIYEESYSYIKEEMKGKEIKSKKFEDLNKDFYLNPFAINETLTIEQILKTNNKCLEKDDALPFTDNIRYEYDFGDSWDFIIKAYEDAKYLSDRVSKSQVEEAINQVHEIARPAVIAADGLPLIEDVGGAYGFIIFLENEEQYEDKKESLIWAKGNGWKGKIGDLKTIL